MAACETERCSYLPYFFPFLSFRGLDVSAEVIINHTHAVPVPENNGEDLFSGTALPLSSSLENAENEEEAADGITVECTTPDPGNFQQRNGGETRARRNILPVSFSRGHALAHGATAFQDRSNTDHSQWVPRAAFNEAMEQMEQMDRELKRVQDDVHRLKRGYVRHCVEEHNRRREEKEEVAQSENPNDWCKEWSEFLVKSNS